MAPVPYVSIKPSKNREVQVDLLYTLNMEKTIKSVIYLICIDKGIIVCNIKDDFCILPCIIFYQKYDNLNALKKDIVSKTKIKIERNNLMFLRHIQEDNLYFFSLVVDLNKGHNEDILRSSGFKNAKGLKFISSLIMKWDDGSKMAIESLKHNPNYKDAFLFINSDDKFQYYSPKTKTIIKRVFDKITNIWQFDRPDVILETTKGMTGVECFQINASGNDSNGSIGAVGKKQMEQELYKGKPWEPITVTRHFSNTLENLWADFVERYNGHIKINEYRNNMTSLNAGMVKSIGFYVNDTTMLGSYYRENGKSMTPLYIFNIKEFWDIFLRNKSLLFIIFQQTESDNKQMFFITKHDYPELLAKGLISNLKDIESQFFNDPNLIGTSFPIPNE